MEYELPQASVARVMKGALPEHSQIGKDTKMAMSKASGIFVLYITAAANDFCKESKRQTISAADVLAAIGELGFDEFEEPLRQFLNSHRQTQKAKKDAQKHQKDLGNDEGGGDEGDAKDDDDADVNGDGDGDAEDAGGDDEIDGEGDDMEDVEDKFSEKEVTEGGDCAEEEEDEKNSIQEETELLIEEVEEAGGTSNDRDNDGEVL